eukprot:9470528-Pyramimonas_sp.AAC.1
MGRLVEEDDWDIHWNRRIGCVLTPPQGQPKQAVVHNFIPQINIDHMHDAPPPPPTPSHCARRHTKECPRRRVRTSCCGVIMPQWKSMSHKDCGRGRFRTFPVDPAEETSTKGPCWCYTLEVLNKPSCSGDPQRGPDSALPVGERPTIDPSHYLTHSPKHPD